jgi:flagellar biosynthetic protein FlhB
MADNNSGAERTEEATPRRRTQARRKGTVAKSTELTNAVVIIALLMILPSAIRALGDAFTQSIHVGFSQIPTTLDHGEIGRFSWRVLQGPLMAFLPILAVAMVAGVAMNFAQVGFVLSTESLTPNLGKLNPLNGIKRLFSPVAAVDGIKATLKSALFGYLAYSAIQSHWNDLVTLGWGTMGMTLSVIGTILHQMFLRVSVAWLALAGLDYYFQRKQTDKQLRMTKQEVKQEMREMEQAPELRGAMNRKRRQLSKRRIRDAVAMADVIVTNPTHFSVAIQYQAGKMHAPQVVAKGQDLVAFKIREFASEFKIPIVPNPPLARQLYKMCEVGDFVPRDMFQAVAEVLAYVYRTMNRNKRKS